MQTALCVLALYASLYTAYSAAPATTTAPADHLNALAQRIKSLEASITQRVSGLARQMMMQQLFVEERIRSGGSSGVKQMRNTGDGTKPYLHNTFSSDESVMAIYDTADHERTVGMGEFIAVLNGVEFRTRHNDYELKMPATKSENYHATEDITFPSVPPSVLSQKTVAEQITEMQQYFKAFHAQDTKIRNYKPYFKPVMCYLEGGWNTDTAHFEEPFESDIHSVDASSWDDLQGKIQYTSATGEKDEDENFAFLPTAVVNVSDDGTPEIAQWNYRILCHPVQTELDLKDIKPVDDIGPRMFSEKNYTSFTRDSKQARFTLAYDRGRRYYEDEGYGWFPDVRYMHGKIDSIMNEIPGIDNYPGHLTDNSFDMLKHRVDMRNATVLDTSRYHRHYKVLQKGAMGLTVRNRGYSDTTLWVAQTSSPHIVKMNVEDCHYDNKVHKKVCNTYEARTTYAVPLELIWLTPLSTWNPYGINVERNPANMHKITDGGRNGGFNTAHAFNGVTPEQFYLTPAEFYHGGAVDTDAADTARDFVGVLDGHGQVQRVSASGIRVFTPEIPGVGRIRLRYPVVPLHQEGSANWKNLLALQDILMDMKTFTNMFEHRPEIVDEHPADTHYATTVTHDNPPGMHSHDLYLTAEEMTALHHNKTVKVYTTENNGHSHELEITNDHNINRLLIVKCDGLHRCWDHHGNRVYRKWNR